MRTGNCWVVVPLFPEITEFWNLRLRLKIKQLQKKFRLALGRIGNHRWQRVSVLVNKNLQNQPTDLTWLRVKNSYLKSSSKKKSDDCFAPPFFPFCWCCLLSYSTSWKGSESHRSTRLIPTMESEMKSPDWLKPLHLTSWQRCPERLQRWREPSATKDHAASRSTATSGPITFLSLSLKSGSVAPRDSIPPSYHHDECS